MNKMSANKTIKIRNNNDDVAEYPKRTPDSGAGVLFYLAPTNYR